MGLAIDPIRDLEKRLRAIESVGTAKFGAHWSRRETSRRVRVREHLEVWWPSHGFDKVPAAIGKRIACMLIGRPKLTSKIAGIALFEAPLGTTVADLPALGELLAGGALADDNLVDWVATKLVAPIVERDPRGCVRTLVDWAGGAAPAQRRCACRALVPHAGDRAYTPIVLLVCGTSVWSHESGDQLLVGALLKIVARVEPARAAQFLRRIAHLMSKQAIRIATEPFPVALRTELLAHWKRATRVRR